jgi:uncharacterized protein YbjT (DUF2867 family)
VDVVTGAFSFSGRYVAAHLLDLGRKVRTLTRRPASENPFQGKVDVRRLDFGDSAALADALDGADTLYNTYWIRFPHEGLGWENVLANTRLLLEAASTAGVRRVVQWSATNARLNSPFPYFRAKAQAEEILRSSGLSFALVRPTLVFGRGEVLLNNVAWLLRRFPVFLLPAGGDYLVQPVAAEDVAAAAVEAGLNDESAVLELGGPDMMSFAEIVRLVRTAVGSRSAIVPTPAAFVRICSRAVELAAGETLVTTEELAGLRANVLVAPREPIGKRTLPDWLGEAAPRLGLKLVSDRNRPWV